MIPLRQYISWSQLNAWEKGEDYFYKVYILGQSFENKEMAFGKKIAEGLEGKIECPEAEFCKIYLPKMPKREYEIKVNFEGVPILVRMDAFDDKKLIIDEYKTGRSPWTQKKVDNHGQLTMYAMAVWKKYGKIPDIRLFWIPTDLDDNGEVVLTGEIPYEFKTQRSLRDFALMYKRLKNAWEGINKFYDKL